MLAAQGVIARDGESTARTGEHVGADAIRSAAVRSRSDRGGDEHGQGGVGGGRGDSVAGVGGAAAAGVCLHQVDVRAADGLLGPMDVPDDRMAGFDQGRGGRRHTGAAGKECYDWDRCKGG